MGAGVRFLCEAAKTDHGFSLMEVTLPKDQGPPRHDHPWDEAYYVVDGDVRFQLGDEDRIFSGGDFVYAPAGMVHGFQGAGDRPARVLVFDAPATAEAFFREMDREIRNIPEDLKKAPEIGRKHKIHFRVPEGA